MSCPVPPSGSRPALRHFRTIVHPERRRQGLGSALLARVEGLPAEAEGTILQTLVPGTWTEAARFYANRGFREVHRGLDLERVGPVPEEIAAPDGFRIRPEVPGEDDADLRRLCDEGFRDDFFHEPADERVFPALREIPGAEILLAETDAGDAAGYTLTHDAGEGRGHVLALVVSEPLRRRGLARALLRTGLRGLHARGRTTIGLFVDATNDPANALYREEGFAVRDTSHTLWRR